jgi:uncharacterized protein (DUF1015 family)
MPVELRPFRALRYSPQVLAERGLAALIHSEEALPSSAPENVSALLYPAGAPQTLHDWTEAGTLVKERRPAMWVYRQTLHDPEGGRVLDLLIALVRLSDSIGPPRELPPSPERSRRVGWIAEMKADFEPSLLVTRAPLTSQLATTRVPDLSGVDGRGVRHDLWRIADFAEHVELQGLVKSAEAVVAGGVESFEAAKQFASGPAAARLPGARYKLCAIVEEALVRDAGMPQVPAGFFGFSLEDAVY